MKGEHQTRMESVELYDSVDHAVRRQRDENMSVAVVNLGSKQHAFLYRYFIFNPQAVDLKVGGKKLHCHSDVVGIVEMLVIVEVGT